MKPVSSPTPSLPAIIIWPPNQRIATLVTYIEAWKIGRFKTDVPKVFVAVCAYCVLTFSKRSETYPSRTYALIARTAAKSSCSASLSLSIAPCITRYKGPTRFTIKKSAIAKKGSTAKYTTASSGLIINAITKPMTSIIGPRINGRVPIAKAF